jgi:two-component system response regulator AtoC
MVDHLAKLIHDDEGSSSIMKILVVDDEPSVCKALRRLLVAKGYNVLEAHDGDQALEVYRRERPDVVLLDIRMPGMDGLETLRELKAIDQGANVIMVTVVVDDEIAKRAMAEGALDYITKPVSPDYIYRALALARAMGLIGHDA